MTDYTVRYSPDKVSAVLLPGIGANYHLGRFNLFGGIHRGYTAPSSGALKITQFGQNVNVGGLDLKAEKSWNMEVGFRSWSPGLTLEVAGFLIRISDIVAAGRGTAFRNLGRADTYGLETALGFGVSRLVPLLPDVNLSYTYLQTEIKKGIVTSATIAGNVGVNITGNELPYAPQHTLTVGLAKQIGDNLRMRADMRFVDEVFTDFENLSGLITVGIPVQFRVTRLSVRVWITKSSINGRSLLRVKISSIKSTLGQDSTRTLANLKPI